MDIWQKNEESHMEPGERVRERKRERAAGKETKLSKKKIFQAKKSKLVWHSTYINPFDKRPKKIARVFIGILVVIINIRHANEVLKFILRVMI